MYFLKISWLQGKTKTPASFLLDTEHQSSKNITNALRNLKFLIWKKLDYFVWKLFTNDNFLIVKHKKNQWEIKSL